MMSPQASSGAATALPMTGTVFTTAPLMRQGAATTLQPEAPMAQTSTNTSSRDLDTAGLRRTSRPATAVRTATPRSISERGGRRTVLQAGVGFVATFVLPSRPAFAEPEAPIDVPYVPTSHATVAGMLDVAGVGPRDVVYDLGSGDGRIPIAAARRGARAVGIDIDQRRVDEARANAAQAGVADRVQFIRGDLFEQDLSKATVITLYLLPRLNLRLRPTLLALEPGTRIVSHGFDMGDWTPDRTITAGNSLVHFWRVPERNERPAAR
jgi:hypothetical protein